MDIIEILKEMSAELEIRHLFPTAACSADDEPGRPTPALIDLALLAARCASQTDLSDLRQRVSGPPYLSELWPGEHYQLLAALMQVLKPNLVLEIGTAAGLSALALKKYLPATSRMVTFDVVPWKNFSDHALRDADFADGRLEQVVADLSDPAVARRYASLLNNADFLFIDAAKDGRLEPALFDNFATIGLKEGAVLFLDDIRMLVMLPLWRRIALPKIDLTSFGHWSGTGMVLWSRTMPWIAPRRSRQ